MYLFVFVDGSVRQVFENLSQADLLAVRAKTLRVFRFGSKFQELVVDDRLGWLAVPSASLLIASDVRLHHS